MPRARHARYGFMKMSVGSTAKGTLVSSACTAIKLIIWWKTPPAREALSLRNHPLCQARRYVLKPCTYLLDQETTSFDFSNTVRHF